MTRYRNSLTGSVVDVPEARGRRLSQEWRPLTEGAPEEPTDDPGPATMYPGLTPDASWAVKSLRSWAAAHDITIPSWATKKADILAAILQHG